MYMLDAQGRHIDQGATEGGEYENLVDGLIIKTKEIKPTRAALIALLKMGPSERTQGRFPKQYFKHSMRIRGEPLKHVRTFQAHVAKLVMEAGMSANRCRLVHPDGTTGVS